MRIALFLSALFAGLTMAHAHGDSPISTAKIAELSAHRVDRLVALGRIDSAYAKRLEKIEVSKEGPAPVAYKAIISQTEPQTGQPLQLELKFDHDGKPLSFKVLPNGAPGPDIGWSPKSAQELVESAMHYVLENGSTEQIAPYFNDFSRLELSKVSLSGKDAALVRVSSSAQTEHLNIYLDPDGTVSSAAVEP